MGFTWSMVTSGNDEADEGGTPDHQDVDELYSSQLLFVRNDGGGGRRRGQLGDELGGAGQVGRD